MGGEHYQTQVMFSFLLVFMCVAAAACFTLYSSLSLLVTLQGYKWKRVCVAHVLFFFFFPPHPWHTDWDGVRVQSVVGILNSAQRWQFVDTAPQLDWLLHNGNKRVLCSCYLRVKLTNSSGSLGNVVKCDVAMLMPCRRQLRRLLYNKLRGTNGGFDCETSRFLTYLPDGPTHLANTHEWCVIIP